jgi:hypothetical protein
MTSEPAMTPPGRQSLAQFRFWALPIALWLLACGAGLGFDLGRYSDDYALSLRSFGSSAGTHPWASLEPLLARWPYFWRPLHLACVYGFSTLLWDHSWVLHLISAIAHLLAVVAFARLLRALELPRSLAHAGACCAFVCAPAVEAVLWPAALGSIVSVAALLFGAERWLVIRARHRDISRTGPAWPGRPGAVRAVIIAAWSFMVACWHEQAAACLLALPLLALALGRTNTPEHPSPLGRIRRGLFASLPATLAALAGVGIYVLLLLITIPAGRRGSPSTLVDISDVDTRLVSFSTRALNEFLGPNARDRLVDGFDFGLPLLAEPVVLVIFGIVLLALVLACSNAPGGADSRSPGAVPPSPSPVALALLGLSMIALPLVPVAMVRGSGLFSRYFYLPWLGLILFVLAIAAATAALFRPGPSRDRASAAFRIALLLLTLPLAVSMLGWQRAFRERSDTDHRIVTSLRALVPNPPLHAVFVPVALAEPRGFRATRSGNSGVLGGLAHPWSSWAVIQRAYDRPDLTSTHLRFGAALPITLDSAGIRYPRGLTNALGVTNPTNTLIPFERAIPFHVDADGVVQLLDPAALESHVPPGR